ncbi:outer membrane immunogenic protein [Methylosinus sp. sav-2]|jgi:outer membrane immunogenic protein|uniref:outer membrane protein n=1 Tax=Methylosinus sp. sav-2 TaxID=2485168 RepID=UPI00047B45D2|nr:outer membrane beta-barrel protein [Methylosinus sp. sav-2]TDX65744.1 outer membrane immunogenic protein [Methylosinus sp. sav-2]
MHIKNSLSALAVAAALSVGAAHAADLPYRKDAPAFAPPPPVFSWTGAYVGLNVGGGFKADNSFGGDVSGVVGGGQIGYNYQISPLFVVGLETDFQGTSLRSNNGFGNASLPWFGTVRGRAGFALLESKLFVYGTGGFAYGELNTPFGSDTRTGWTAGGGVEYAFLPNWSAKVEYLYTDLTNNGGFAIGPQRAKFHTVRAGINYHFNLF